jgi:hypothetical protein
MYPLKCFAFDPDLSLLCQRPSMLVTQALPSDTSSKTTHTGDESCSRIVQVRDTVQAGTLADQEQLYQNIARLLVDGTRDARSKLPTFEVTCEPATSSLLTIPALCSLRSKPCMHVPCPLQEESCMGKD